MSGAIAASLLSAFTAAAQNPPQQTALPSAAVSAALGVPKPGPTNDAPYAPQPILQGGVVILTSPYFSIQVQ
jgi:hypothetical protein